MSSMLSYWKYRRPTSQISKGAFSLAAVNVIDMLHQKKTLSFAFIPTAEIQTEDLSVNYFSNKKSSLKNCKDLNIVS